MSPSSGCVMFSVGVCKCVAAPRRMTVQHLMGVGRCAGPAIEPANGLLNMPSLQSTLHTRPPDQVARPDQPPAAQASFGQGARPMMVRSPSLDTWGEPSTGAPRRAVDAQALSGFHSGSWVRSRCVTCVGTALYMGALLVHDNAESCQNLSKLCKASKKLCWAPS